MKSLGNLSYIIDQTQTLVIIFFILPQKHELHSASFNRYSHTWSDPRSDPSHLRGTTTSLLTWHHNTSFRCKGIAHPGRCQKLCIGIYSRLPLTPVNLHGSSCSLEQSMHYFFQMQMFENIKYAQTGHKRMRNCRKFLIFITIKI